MPKHKADLELLDEGDTPDGEHDPEYDDALGEDMFDLPADGDCYAAAHFAAELEALFEDDLNEDLDPFDEATPPA